MNKLSCFCAWLLVALGTVACSRPSPRVTAELERTTAWSPDFVERFGSLPLQHEGRVMPFSTLAAFTLYAVHGRRDVQFVTSEQGRDQKHKLNPTEWLLDVWCFPDQAARYPLFRIENVKVLEALGFEHEGQKQGFEFLSYAQLLPQGQKLTDLTEKLRSRNPTVRSEVENQLVHLFEQLLVYHRLHQQLAELHHEGSLQGDGLRAVFGGAERVRLATILQRAGAFRDFVRAAGPNGEKIEDPQFGNLAEVVQFLTEVVSGRGGPLLLPPTLPVADADTWHSLPEVVDRGMRGSIAAEHVQMITSLQDGLMAKTMPERERHLLAYRDQVDAAAARRGDQQTVALESYYYGANWHFHAMMTFVLGFLAAVVACVLPRARIVWWAAMLVSGGALVMLIADVWIRCLITGHPPITRLYDTFLFIGGGGALTLLIAEFLLSRRICLVLAPLWGALLILLARLFEVADGADTMKPLQAVLLSNFWLGIHVPTMNVGYFASAVAALVACTWIIVRVLRIEHPDSTLAKALVRTTYGITCFGLATAVVGTILGGVWANDSWGRFWGWDPKENGALLICLSQIALLHARMSGLVRDAGFVLWSVATGMIVVFSWFHTNLLGVGLHAYGFSKDLVQGVWVSYSILGGLIVAGALDVLLRPNPAPIKPPLPDALPATE